MENADDIRLSVRLYNKCRADKLKVRYEEEKEVLKMAIRREGWVWDQRMGFPVHVQIMMNREGGLLSSIPYLYFSLELTFLFMIDQQFCKDISPGDARVKDCLEEHLEELTSEPNTKGCKEEIEAMITSRVRDFRLDSKLKAVCEKDISELCLNFYVRRKSYWRASYVSSQWVWAAT
jgi:hypothetical protein